MHFDPMKQPYHSNRFCLTAGRGMVASSSALASQAGLTMLKEGGNAVDAIVAAAAVLAVVEPVSNSLGSDAFSLVWMDGKLHGLNASGYAPSRITAEKVLEKYPSGQMPLHGWAPVTVPGVPAAWAELNARFGRLPFKRVLEPAITYAQEGFPVPPMMGFLLERVTAGYHRVFGEAPEFAEWFRVFTKDGEPYRFGEIMRLPDHAKSLRLIAESGAREFYEGEIARQLIRQSDRDGGYFTPEDLAQYKPLWVDPIHVDYRGYDVWEIPPNGQGIVVLMALNILKNFDFEGKEREDPQVIHKQMEAMKMAFADGMHYVTDPAYMGIDYHELITPEFGEKRAAQITQTASLPQPMEIPGSGTVYLCAADGDGGMVSFIQSCFNDSGSGIVVEGYGVALQDRGADFSLDPSHYNYLMPGKRSYHTIIPGFITREGKAVGPFGVMGKYMQPQGQVQVASNLIDFHMNPQMALDAPRWQWTGGLQFEVEPSFDKVLTGTLRGYGHEISTADPVGFGRGQVILRQENGVLIGACESRTDSGIACY